MAATINGRELGDDLLRDLFHRLDAGQTRAQIRAAVKSAQGRGISNETIAALRKTHVQLRRSQGYGITKYSRTKLRSSPDAPLTPVSRLKTRITGEGPVRLSPSRRPKAPRIEGVGQIEIVQFEKRFDGRPAGVSEVRQFHTGLDRKPLEEQITEAEDEGFETRERASLGRGRRYHVLAVMPDIHDL